MRCFNSSSTTHPLTFYTWWYDNHNLQRCHAGVHDDMLFSCLQLSTHCTPGYQFGTSCPKDAYSVWIVLVRTMLDSYTLVEMAFSGGIWSVFRQTESHLKTQPNSNQKWSECQLNANVSFRWLSAHFLLDQKPTESRPNAIKISVGFRYVFRSNWNPAEYILNGYHKVYRLKAFFIYVPTQKQIKTINVCLKFN